MPISLQCPSCGLKLRVPDGVAGKLVRCKKCETPIAVPGNRSSSKSSFAFDEERTTPIRPRQGSRTEGRDGGVASRGSGVRGVLWLPLLLVLILGSVVGGYFAYKGLAPSATIVAKGKAKTVETSVASAEFKKATEAPLEERRTFKEPVGEAPKSTPAPIIGPSPKDPEPEAMLDPPVKKLPVEANDTPKKPQPLKLDDVRNNFAGGDPNRPVAEGPQKSSDGAMTFAVDPVYTAIAIRVGNDEKTLYTVSGPTVRVWDLADYKELASTELPPQPGERDSIAACFSHDGKKVAFSYGKVLQVCDLETKQIDAFEDGRAGKNLPTLLNLFFSADDNLLITNSHLGQLDFWDVAKRSYIPTKSMVPNAPSASPFHFVPTSGNLLLFGVENGGVLRLRSIPDLKDMGDVKGSSRKTYTWPVLSPKKTLAAAGIVGGGLALFDMKKKAIVKEAPLREHLIKDLPLNPFGNKVVSLNSIMAISPGDSTLAFCDGYNVLHVYNLPSLGLRGQLKLEPVRGRGSVFHQVAFRGNDKMIVAAGRAIKVFDRNAMELVK